MRVIVLLVALASAARADDGWRELVPRDAHLLVRVPPWRQAREIPWLVRALRDLDLAREPLDHARPSYLALRFGDSPGAVPILPFRAGRHPASARRHGGYAALAEGYRGYDPAPSEDLPDGLAAARLHLDRMSLGFDPELGHSAESCAIRLLRGDGRVRLQATYEAREKSAWAKRPGRDSRIPDLASFLPRVHPLVLAFDVGEPEHRGIGRLLLRALPSAAPIVDALRHGDGAMLVAGGLPETGIEVVVLASTEEPRLLLGALDRALRDLARPPLHLSESRRGSTIIDRWLRPDPFALLGEKGPIVLRIPEPHAGAEARRRVARIMEERLSDAGIEGSVRLREDRIVVRPDSAEARAPALGLVTARGGVEFRITVEPGGPAHAALAARFDRSRRRGRIERTLPPARLGPALRKQFPLGLRWYRARPGGLSRERHHEGWVLCRLDAHRISTGDLEAVEVRPPVAPAGPGWRVVFQVKRGARRRMARLTAKEGEHLAVVVNGRVEAAPLLRSELSDSGMIQGRYDAKEARRIAAYMRTPAVDPPLAFERVDSPDFEAARRRFERLWGEDGARIRIGSWGRIVYVLVNGPDDLPERMRTSARIGLRHAALAPLLERGQSLVLRADVGRLFGRLRALRAAGAIGDVPSFVGSGEWEPVTLVVSRSGRRLLAEATLDESLLDAVARAPGVERPAPVSGR